MLLGKNSEIEEELPCQLDLFLVGFCFSLNRAFRFDLLLLLLAF